MKTPFPYVLLQGDSDEGGAGGGVGVDDVVQQPQPLWDVVDGVEQREEQRRLRLRLHDEALDHLAGADVARLQQAARHGAVA